jgi:hypothetical protein
MCALVEIFASVQVETLVQSQPVILGSVVT